jgi:hypothetical protein
LLRLSLNQHDFVKKRFWFETKTLRLKHLKICCWCITLWMFLLCHTPIKPDFLGFGELYRLRCGLLDHMIKRSALGNQMVCESLGKGAGYARRRYITPVHRTYGKLHCWLVFSRFKVDDANLVITWSRNPHTKTPIPGKPSKSSLIGVWHKNNLYLGTSTIGKRKTPTQRILIREREV